MTNKISIPNPLSLWTDLKPVVKVAIVRSIAIIIILFFISSLVFLGVILTNGNLDGKDIVNIIEAFKGVVEKK